MPAVPAPLTIAIVGASVRAAAFSALRAGFAPVGLDLFADWDLRQRATAIRLQRYPDGSEAAVAQHDVDAWMYTGGIENHPELVDRIAAIRRLWGNPGATLRAARDPFLCVQAFTDAGICCPPVTGDPEGLPCDGSWLEKPLQGSGGAGIRPWKGVSDLPRSKAAEPQLKTSEVSKTSEVCAGGDKSGNSRYKAPTRFFQKRIPGTPCSAVFVAAGGRSVLLGATWQLVGTCWTGAAEFCYAGSIGPIELHSRLETQWNRIGDCIAERFALVGLFGVDAILDGSTVWPVEINPRYPASVEVLERALGVSAVRLHADVCCLKRLPNAVPRAAIRCCGKAILYAPANTTVPPVFRQLAWEQMKPWPWPDLADVPEVGSPLRRGKPVATVFTEGDSEASVRETLKSRLAAVRRACFPCALPRSTEY